MAAMTKFGAKVLRIN